MRLQTHRGYTSASKYRTWRDGKAPIRDDIIDDIRRCVCWADLYRLLKWHVIGWLDIYRDYCWADLCIWAWATYSQNREDREIFPPKKGAVCAVDVGRCGRCWCGKFNNLTPAGIAGKE